MNKKEGPLFSIYHPGHITGEELKNISDTLDDRHTTIGTEGNAWNNEMNGVLGFSKVVNIKSFSVMCIVGAVYASTTLKVYVSADGENFYYSKGLTDSLTPNTYPDVPVWDSTVNYKTGDMVSYTVDTTESIYTALRSNKDKTPTNTDYWNLTYENIGTDYPQVFTNGARTAAKYVQLQSTNDVRATVTILAKP